MIRFIRQWIIDTLGFSKSEANGTLVLILVTFLAAVLPKIYLIESRSNKESFTADQESLRQWGEELESFLELKESKSPEVTSPIVEPKSFPFDPNTASLQDLISLGFSEKAAKAAGVLRPSSSTKTSSSTKSGGSKGLSKREIEKLTKGSKLSKFEHLSKGQQTKGMQDEQSFSKGSKVSKGEPALMSLGGKGTGLKGKGN